MGESPGTSSAGALTDSTKPGDFSTGSRMIATELVFWVYGYAVNDEPKGEYKQVLDSGN
jgi:hypothetical protein